MQVLKQSTITTILVGPVLDASGVAVTSAAIGDFNITKNGTSAAMSGNTINHSHNGHYTIALTAANTDTLGRLTVSVNNAAMAMAPFRFTVLAAAAFDALVTNGNIASSTSGRTIAVDVSGGVNAVLDSAGRLAIWNVLSTESFTADSMGARLLISDGTNGRQVKVTGAKHVAADVHECQADGLSASTEITAINTFATRVTTGLVSDGPVWQFTANMLELAPSGTGVDELIALQEEILDAINGYISGLTAVAVESPGSITGFPESLRIGDSYTDVLGRGIQIPIVDVNGNPISSVGSKNFADAEAAFVIKRFSDTEPLRIINGTALFIDPPGTGTSAGETPYALIEIPSSETAKGLVKYKYTGLLTFTWPYVGTGTDAEVMTFETGTITFET